MTIQRPRRDLQRLAEGAFEHAPRKRLFADDRTAEKGGRGEREQHRGLPLNEALIVQQQRRRAQDEHHRDRDDVHGLESAGAQPCTNTTTLQTSISAAVAQ